jgi:hypothetical protein
VPNLTLIGKARLGPFRLFGLGGDVLPDLLGEEVPIDGGRGRLRLETISYGLAPRG